jgi:hypothetical protein
MNRTKLTPLIELKDGVFIGEQNLMQNLAYLSEAAKLTHHELYKAVLKEYRKYRGIYDMEFGYYVMSVRLVGLLGQFKIDTRELDRVIGWFNKDLIRSSLYYYKNHVISDMPEKVYPRPHPEVINDLMELVDQISRFLDLPKGNFEGLGHLKEQIQARFIMAFYRNWPTNVKKPASWFNECLDLFKALPIQESMMIQYTNTLERFNDNLKDQVYSFDIVPYRLLSNWQRIKQLFK